MEYIKFKVKHTDITTKDYSNRITTGPQVQDPELWILAENSGAVLVFPDRMYCWVGNNTLQYLTEIKGSNDPVPVSQGIDGNILLKAIAIAQDPTLAMQLIKE